MFEFCTSSRDITEKISDVTGVPERQGVRRDRELQTKDGVLKGAVSDSEVS